MREKSGGPYRLGQVSERFLLLFALLQTMTFAQDRKGTMLAAEKRVCIIRFTPNLGGAENRRHFGNHPAVGF